MAIIYCAPLPLSSVRLMEKYSHSPSRWRRTRLPNAAPLHSQARKGTAGFRFPATRLSFSSWKKPQGTRKVTSEMPGYRPASPVTESTWNEYVVNSDIPVLVEFWASWCGPCRMVHRVIEEIAPEYAGKIKFFMLNTDLDFDFATDYGVVKVPTVLLFKNGVKQASITGTMPNSFYMAAIEKSLAPSEGSESE